MTLNKYIEDSKIKIDVIDAMNTLDITEVLPSLFFSAKKNIKEKYNIARIMDKIGIK